MRKSHLIIVCFLLTINVNGFSQLAQEQNGYIVTRQNDTITGSFIINKDLTHKVSFRDKSNTEFKEYSPAQLKSFSYGQDIYFKSINAIDGNDSLPIFAKCLIEGDVSLFKREDYYYITSADKKMMKLDKKDKIKDGNLVEDKRYVGILRYFMSDCNQIIKQINNVAFYDKPLTEIVSKYNNYKNPQLKSKSHLARNPIIFKYGVRIGTNIGTIKYSDNSDYGNSSDFTTTMNYTGGCFINLALKNVSIQPEILLTKKAASLTRKGSLWNQYTYYSANYLQIPLSLYYSFQYQKFIPLISAGVVLGRAINQSAYRTENNLKTQLNVDKNEYGFRGGLGLTYQFAKHINVGFEYVFEYTILNQSAFESMDHITHNFTLRFTY